MFAKESGAPEANDIDHWDVNFWSERLREAKYDINEVFFFIKMYLFVKRTSI